MRTLRPEAPSPRGLDGQRAERAGEIRASLSASCAWRRRRARTENVGVAPDLTHAPEHAVNGRLADLEAHFVHMNAEGATAVVGVFYRIGRHPNKVLDQILLSAPATAGEEAHAGKASPARLFDGIRGVE